MNSITDATKDWLEQVGSAWNRFWFTPTMPHTLALIRILAGSMLLYTHLVWATDLMAFLGPNSWIPKDVSQAIHPSDYAWTFWWLTDSPPVVWTIHIAALAVFLMFTLGLFTRVTSVLAFFLALSYVHRLEGALFGLDQVNIMLAMYLMIGASGSVYSMDRWLAKRRAGGELPPPEPRVSTTVATRLLQLHMCIVYLFGGITKMMGTAWWDGTAIWLATFNSEYQSFDVTWMGHYPVLLAFMTHLTVAWETFYICLVWPRLSRPVVLAIAAAVHLGIASSLGMITFGLAMLFGNMAFLTPDFSKALVAKLCSFFSPTREMEPTAAQTQPQAQAVMARRRDQSPGMEG